VMDLSH